MAGIFIYFFVLVWFCFSFYVYLVHVTADQVHCLSLTLQFLGKAVEVGLVLLHLLASDAELEMYEFCKSILFSDVCVWKWR